MRTKLFALLLALLLVFSLACCTGEGSGSPKTATCGSCGRTFEAGDSEGNYMSIARTHMCKNCYNNFQWAQEALGK